MSILPLGRIQCDTCRSVHVLTASNSKHWGSELYDAGWRARLIKGRYKHACSICAADLIAEFEGKKGEGSIMPTMRKTPCQDTTA